VAVTGREILLVSTAIIIACTARIRPTAIFQIRSWPSRRSTDWSITIVYLLYFRPFTRALFGYLSAAGFAMMTATTLPSDYFNHIIAKNKVEFLIERHRD
jgi:hypothetical protein